MLGQVVFANDRQRIDARLAAAAEHFGDHPFAVVNVRRKANHLEDDFVVGLGILCAGIAQQHRPAEHGAIDLHEGAAGRFEIRADELMRVALDDFDDLALRIGPADVALLLQPHEHRVAATRRRAFGRRG